MHSESLALNFCFCETGEQRNIGHDARVTEIVALVLRLIFELGIWI